MSGYFYTLLVTSVCGALCVVLSYGGFEKYMKYIASLVCVAVIILPMKNIEINIDNTMDIPQYDTSEQSPLFKTTSELTEERAESYISEIVFQKFGIKPIESNINIDWMENEAVITSVSVSFLKTDREKSHLAREYLCEVLGGDVELVEVEQLS